MNADLQKVFQSTLGRAPSDSEASFFQKFIDEGHLQPYEIGQYLQASPEAMQNRLPAQTQQYSDALAGQDQAIMSKAGDSLASQFYQQGRPRSSGYTAAYLNAARDLAISRQPQIADFYGQGLQGVNQGYQNFGAGNVSRGYGLRDEARQRQYQIEDYFRQQNDFNTYQNTANRQARIGAIGGLAGTAIGAGLGSFGGPFGAAVGGKLGGQIGGGIGAWG